MTTRKAGDSMKANFVPSKSRPMSPEASPPARSVGRNGRMPAAPARPAPCRMSRSSFTVCGTVAAVRATASMPSRTPKGSGSTARDLERYAGLFASRTRVMTSSAMRDLMAITERPEIISLAGGLPDTSTFPAERLAAIMSKVAADSSAKALQYAPTEGMAGVAHCIVEVMAEEGTIVDPQDVLVTTGGQQVIDLVCKT